jgi:outer membrane protein OmpA-like peptidoglycan-associated protein
LSISIMSIAGGARAEGFDGELYQPAAGAAGGFVVERPLVPRHLGFGLGAFVGYGHRPVVIHDRASDTILAAPLENAMTLDAVGSIGLGNFFELAVHLPVRPVWRGDATAAYGQSLRASAGLGDVRVMPKFGIVDTGSDSFHFSLGAAIPVSLPTGNGNAMRGSGGVSGEPRLLLGIGGSRWDWIFSGGYLFRSGNDNLTGNKEITFGSAFTFNVTPALDLQLEVYGKHLPDTLTAGSKTPVESLLGAIIWPSDHVSIYVGAGPGLTSGLTSPDFRAILGLRYGERVPGRDRFRDKDGDGIDNDRDKCPNQAEDRDGFEDDDGCPEADNDHDGILDDDDECPNDVEEVGGDGDGCPDKARVILEDGKVVVVGKVQFESGSAVMKKKSEPLIDDVAALLKQHPEMKHVKIEGHTDNTGPKEYNDRLSKERAETVKKALIQRGIAADRLETEGYGPSKPMAPNETPAGRARNRRVEFTIHE